MYRGLVVGGREFQVTVFHAPRALTGQRRHRVYGPPKETLGDFL